MLYEIRLSGTRRTIEKEADKYTLNPITLKYQFTLHGDKVFEISHIMVDWIRRIDE